MNTENIPKPERNQTESNAISFCGEALGDVVDAISTATSDSDKDGSGNILCSIGEFASDLADSIGENANSISDSVGENADAITDTVGEIIGSLLD